MDSVKVKNLIILILLAVNIVLLSVFIADTARERDLSGGAVEGVVALLEENGIAVSQRAELSERSLPALSVSRDTGLERTLAAAVLGEVSVSDLGGNILRYSGEYGMANFRGTGGFEIVLHESRYDPERPLESARSLAADLGLETMREPGRTDIDPDTLEGTIELICALEDSAVVNCRLSFTFAAGRIVTVIGTRVLDNVVLSQEVRLLDVPTVLLRFLGLVQEGGHVCSEISSLELCYIMTASAAGEGELTPVWQIATDAGDFYINAVSGQEESIT